MSSRLLHPPFGHADLTNCERELIHLAGSIQPHGVLVVLREPDLVILQASVNAETMLGTPAERLLNRPVSALGGDIAPQIRRLVRAGELEARTPLRCRIAHGETSRAFEGIAHRHPGGGLVVELEPVGAGGATAGTLHGPNGRLEHRLATAMQRFSAATSIAALAEAVVQSIRELTGYDRVMVYKFDPDGHGEIIAEAKDARLAESFLGLHYPATDIPQRARELYVRNRVRVLVDVGYTPVPIVPRRFPLTGEELDMSLCYLRSMSPLHLQYLQNMGVTATLVASLVREGRLWGLIACHHYSPLHVGYALRAACELLAEVISTRIAAIENYVQAQTEVLVRRLEQRLMEATSTEGDWRLALFRDPRTLLAPLDATGAALFYEGEVLTAGEVPSTPELRALAGWVAERTGGGAPFTCDSLARENPAFAPLTALASGVLAIELSRSRPEYLMWFRKEQLSTVTCAGDPAKAVIGNDPLELSPRRSFAAWSEIVRGTATPWSAADLALARAIGASLMDIIVQIQAVRLLIAQHQLTQVRLTVENSREPVVIADAVGHVLFTNEAFSQLFRRPHIHLEHLDELAALFTDPVLVRTVLSGLRRERQPWRGELTLAVSYLETLPVGVRADVVPGQGGAALGFILIFTDLTGTKRVEAARRQLEDSISRADRRAGAPARPAQETDEVIGAILANASVAAMEITDASSGPSVAELLAELEASTRRAAALYGQMRDYAGDE
jgi:light-regulated signal transduction histidine kinase (bacteriophytochrome)